MENTFTYEQLTEDAQEKARDWFRESNLDYNWWDSIEEDAVQVANLMGITLDNMYFSGFSSQGDGACFEGSYSYAKGGFKAVKDYAPMDTVLHGIASSLQDIQRRNFYSITTTVKHSGHYYHEMCTNISVEDGRDTWDEPSCADDIIDLLRDFMRWIYKQLEAEYDYMQSDEQIVESININSYEFDEEGVIT